jgi:hypothetical protein
MKKIKQLAAVIALSSMLAACSSTPLPQELEYKVLRFDRDDVSRFERELNELTAEGWSINSSLTEEGTNDNDISGKYLLLQRKKLGK